MCVISDCEVKNINLHHWWSPDYGIIHAAITATEPSNLYQPGTRDSWFMPKGGPNKGILTKFEVDVMIPLINKTPQKSSWFRKVHL